MLLFVELALTVAGAGAPRPFFLRQTDAGGQDWYLTNSEVGENWFPGNEWEARIKIPRLEFFPVAKPGDSYRVFVLGESSAYGALLDDHMTWASQLEFILNAAQQERQVQVINCGVRASTTSIYPKIIEELQGYQPDLFVLYAGHNEYYGVREEGWLRQRRLVRLLSTAMNSEADDDKPSTDRVGIRAEFEVPPGHELERTVPLRFRRDLDRLVEAADDVPLLVYTVHGNEESFAPLCSAGPGAEGPQAAPIDEMLHGFEAAPLEAGHEFCPKLEERLETYPQHAGLHHAVGMCKGMAGDRETALEHYRQAIELDCLPLRARGAINEELAALATRHPDRAVALCDLEPAFRRESPSGAICHRLILDHLHPNVYGSYVVAIEGARVILGDERLGLAGGPAGAGALPGFEAVQHGQSIGELDQFLTALRCRSFYANSSAEGTASRERTGQLIDYQQSARMARFDDPTRSVAEELRADADDGHLRVAQKYLDIGDAERAIAEARVAVLATPASADARLLLSQLLLEGGDEQGAREQMLLIWLLDPDLVVENGMAAQLGFE